MALPSDSATSRGVSPPSQGISSLVQEIGLMPILTPDHPSFVGGATALPAAGARKGSVVLPVLFRLGIYAFCCRLPCSYAARALRTLSRSQTSGTATSHQQPPSSVVRFGSVSMQTTYVRSAARARLSAASSSLIVFTL